MQKKNEIIKHEVLIVTSAIAFAFLLAIGLLSWEKSACWRLKTKCENAKLSQLGLLLQCGGFQVEKKVNTMTRERCKEILDYMD